MVAIICLCAARKTFMKYIFRVGWALALSRRENSGLLTTLKPKWGMRDPQEHAVNLHHTTDEVPEFHTCIRKLVFPPSQFRVVIFPYLVLISHIFFICLLTFSSYRSALARNGKGDGVLVRLHIFFGVKL